MSTHSHLADGTWSDYIYANGQRLARADSYDERIHISGTSTVAGSYAEWSLPFASYVIKSGDKISWRQYQTAAEGGIGMGFTDNTYANWIAKDTDGQLINSDTTEGTWHDRTVDLSAFAGKTVASLGIVADAATPVGSWNIFYGDIAIYSADGTVTTIYERAPSSSFSYSSNGGETNTAAAVERSATAGDAELPANTTTYYVADQIGSSRMLLTAGGWPVSQDTYYPFGAEPYPAADQNHYKFSGKERDAESGNDNFGARYYSSAMGRFLTPDFSDAPEAMPYADLGNPQSFNRYVYANNNPLGGIDPDGHFSYSQNGQPCGDYGSINYAGGEIGGGPVSATVPCSAPDNGSYSADNGEGQEWANDTAQAAIEGLANSLQGLQSLSTMSLQAIEKAANYYHYDVTDFENTMTGSGARNGIDPNMLVGLAYKESSLDPFSTNGGLFQIQPSRAKDLGIAAGDIANFHVQIPKVAAALSSAISTLHGNLDLGIASWTLGVRGTQKLFSSGGMQSVRGAWLDRNHHNFGQVGPNYIDVVKGFEP